MLFCKTSDGIDKVVDRCGWFFAKGTMVYSTSSKLASLKRCLPCFMCYEKEYLNHAMICKKEYVVIKRKIDKKEYSIYFIDSNCDKTMITKKYLEIAR